MDAVQGNRVRRSKRTSSRIPQVSMKRQCAQWDNKQCRATKDLISCVMNIAQGKILIGPEKVVVPLCPKHFQLLIPPPKAKP